MKLKYQVKVYHMRNNAHAPEPHAMLRRLVWSNKNQRHIIDNDYAKVTIPFTEPEAIGNYITEALAENTEI